jgi:hypothetical protein
MDLFKINLNKSIMKNWKETLEQVQGMIERIYICKAYKMYADLDTMIRITKEFINMKLDSNNSEERIKIYMNKINELVLKLESPFARKEINEILYP